MCGWLWSNQYERVGKAYARVCEEFTTYAFDEYEPGLAAAQAAMGNGDRGPVQQRRQFTIDQLTMVCLKLKLGKWACRDGVYTSGTRLRSACLVQAAAECGARTAQSCMR